MFRLIILIISISQTVGTLRFTHPAYSIDSVLLRFGLYSALQSPEKVYVHTDKQVYCAGEYMWFNAYVENSSPLSLLPESNFVYVELIKDSVLSRVKIKRTPEGFTGRVPLESDLQSGKYTLRAYTSWMNNFPEGYLFHTEITIVNPVQERESDQTMQALFSLSDPESEKVENAPHSALFEVQFLPESGRYIAGDLAMVAFKAIDRDGRGLDISGTVYNGRDSVVTVFSDTYNGMGKFTFYPQENETYYAVVRNEDGVELRHELPPLSPSGAVIHVAERGGKRYIGSVVTESLMNKPLYLVLSNGGEVFLCNPIVEKEYSVVVDEAQLFRGINHATIVDDDGQVYAQRLFFVYPSDIIVAHITGDKEAPGKREKVTYSIYLCDTLQRDIQGTFSLSVTDKYLVPHDNSEHLLSYMLLSSELHGGIENPSAYFDFIHPQTKEAMDLLMMTQGWRYYDMPTIFTNSVPEPVLEKEYTQTISGKVTGIFNRVSRSNIVVYAPELDLSLFEAMNRTGQFQIRDLDFPDSTTFVLSCSGQRGSTGYYLEIDNSLFPLVTPYRFLGKKSALSAQQTDDLLYEFGLSFKDEKITQLQPAVVTAAPAFFRPAINPSPYNQYFESRQIRERKQLAPFDGMQLIDYILSSFSSVIFDGVDERGLRRMRSTATTSVKGSNEPIVYIDKMKMENTGDLDMMYVGDIENIVVLRPSESGVLYSGQGVIFVSTRRSFTQRDHVINTKIISPLGWQKPYAFYSPNYALTEDNDAVKYDNRTTLYWNPFIETDENGKAEVSFYTSDRNTSFRFHIEGLTHEGGYISIVQ